MGPVQAELPHDRGRGPGQPAGRPTIGLSRPLLRADVARAAGRAASWLREALRRVPADDRESLLTLGPGLALCATITGATDGDVASALAEWGDAIRPVTLDDLAECEGETVLLACLAHRGSGGGPLAALDEYARQAASAFQGEGASSLDAGWYGSSFLLWRLGRLRRPLSPAPDWPPDPMDALLRPDSSLRALAASIAAQTAFGRRRIPPRPDVAGAIEAAAFCALRRYDLQLGSLFLRTRAYLGHGSRLALTTARAFLLDNQTPDGGFGFVAREVADLRERDPEFDSVRLRVPITTACLWALAETGPGGYRLYWRLGTT